jgi:hypothetical protein
MREEKLSGFATRFADLEPIAVLIGAVCMALVLGSGVAGAVLGKVGLAAGLFASALAVAALGFIIMTVQAAKESRALRKD